ncbi:MAG: ABC transporter permease [Wenzhouxiangellaceae bacterium]
MGIKPILLGLRQNKFIAVIVILQVAVTLAAVSHSVFSTNLLLKDWNVPSGLNDHSLITTQAQFFIDDVDMARAIRTDLDRLAELPGVDQVVATNQVPFEAERISAMYKASGEEAQRYLGASFEFSGDPISLLGIELLAGRSFYDNEYIKAPLDANTQYPSVVMISESLGREMFGDESPLGKTLWPVINRQPAEIVGVYSDFMTGVTLNSLGKSYNSIIRPMTVWSDFQFDPGYLMRFEGGNGDMLLDRARETIYQQEGRYVHTNELLSRTKKRMFDGRSSQAIILMSVSAMLILITALGMAGMVAFLVGQRQKQIGIRRALGASKRRILQYFLVENSLMTIVGLVLGTILTILIALYFPVLGTSDALNYTLLLIVAALLWGINIIAVYRPAKKATNIEPASVMK